MRVRPRSFSSRDLDLCTPIAAALRTCPRLRVATTINEARPGGRSLHNDRALGNPKLVSGVADERKAHARTPDDCALSAFVRAVRNCTTPAVLTSRRLALSMSTEHWRPPKTRAVSIDRPRGCGCRSSDIDQGLLCGAASQIAKALPRRRSEQAGDNAQEALRAYNGGPTLSPSP
jgi:hypothetical protein